METRAAIIAATIAIKQKGTDTLFQIRAGEFVEIKQIGDDVMRQNGLRILLAAIVAVAAMPAAAGTPTGGPGIQQGPVIGTGVLEKPDLVAGFGEIRGRNGLFLGNVCASYLPKVTIDARNRLFITSKGELVFRFNHPITNRGLRPAKNFMSRLRTTNLRQLNTASVQSVARLNPGQSTTLSFEFPILLQHSNINANQDVQGRLQGLEGPFTSFL